MAVSSVPTILSDSKVMVKVFQPLLCVICFGSSLILWALDQEPDPSAYIASYPHRRGGEGTRTCSLLPCLSISRILRSCDQLY
jgi:hypothetical protein